MNNTPLFGYKTLALSAIFVAALFSMAPKAHADFDFGRIIDPLCIFACEDDEPKRVTKNVTTTNTYTNSNNVNSNINSPGAVVVDGNSYNDTPVYAYDYPSYPSYPQYNDPLSISCYPLSLNAREGETVKWVANVYGGNGSYNYSWSGTNGLSGQGSAVSKRYNTSGYKNATVRVVSGNQSKSHNCDATVYVEGDNDDDYYPDYPYYPQNYPISVSCSVTPSFIQTGGTATWTAYATGGNGYFTYSWSGTEGLYGSGQSVYNRYYNPGTKYGTVTVRSGNQTVTRSCGNTLTVGTAYVTGYPIYNQYPVISNDLDIGCYADPANPRINQPITWTAEVTGGQAPYVYSWTGSEGLSGSQSSVIKYYGTTGEKSAIISITSADGKSTSRACSQTVTVRPAASTVQPAPAPVVDTSDNNSGLTAASLFSLKNVPWGLVAILVILILFATVLYLLFNREKI